MKKYSFFIILLTFLSCSKEKLPELSPEALTGVLNEMTEIMIHDVTNPPLAARFFSYACLSGYEVMAQHDSSLHSMHGVLNGFPEIEKPQGLESHAASLTAVLAMMETSKKMQPSGSRMAAYEKHFLDSCKTIGFSEQTLEHSQKYAEQISQQLLKYAKKDRYNRISNYPRYQAKNQEGQWYPTPPGYFAPVEPYFATVRPFTLDTCSQFKPAPPVAFSRDKNSEFYKLMLINYQEKLPADHKEIAAFWDCNPFALEDNGHLMVGMKKISPGAHWLGITGIACKKAGLPLAQTLKIHTLVSITLMDGFICCWDEKYRSNRIRPETAIRQLMDPNWRPFLQTPPFPEYLSGHSTISTAVATVLTHYLGDNFAYTDTVEEPFGLKARSFTSFRQAAEEAGISRLYGGIHFMDAIVNGQTQGEKVGAWVIDKMEGKTRVLASL